MLVLCLVSARDRTRRQSHSAPRLRGPLTWQKTRPTASAQTKLFTCLRTPRTTSLSPPPSSCLFHASPTLTTFVHLLGTQHALPVDSPTSSSAREEVALAGKRSHASCFPRHGRSCLTLLLTQITPVLSLTAVDSLLCSMSGSRVEMLKVGYPAQCRSFASSVLWIRELTLRCFSTSTDLLPSRVRFRHLDR